MEDFHKYTKIKQLGHEENEDIFKDPEDEIEITEKIDGANFRFAVFNGKLIIGSRTQQLTSDEGEDTNISKNFKRCTEFVRELFDKNPERFKSGWIFYGECCVKHSLPYNWEKIPPFLGFAIYNIEEQRYRKDWADIYESIGLPTVPIVSYIKAGDIKEFKDEDVVISSYCPKSNPKMQAEGVVFKNYSKQIFAKYVRAQFKEINAETFGGTPKYEETDTGKVGARYCINARIDKCIFKLIDDGFKLEMAMMKELPMMVYKDIMEEHGQDLLMSKMTIDFQQLRKIVTRRCLAVLKQVITNNALRD